MNQIVEIKQDLIVPMEHINAVLRNLKRRKQELIESLKQYGQRVDAEELARVINRETSLNDLIRFSEVPRENIVYD